MLEHNLTDRHWMHIQCDQKHHFLTIGFIGAYRLAQRPTLAKSPPYGSGQFRRATTRDLVESPIFLTAKNLRTATSYPG